MYNALSDVKPEVENVIKMGRKLVEGAAENGLEDAAEVSKKIDSLKEDFNETGGQVRRKGISNHFLPGRFRTKLSSFHLLSLGKTFPPRAALLPSRKRSHFSSTFEEKKVERGDDDAHLCRFFSKRNFPPSSSQITEAKKVLERSLEMSESLQADLAKSQMWLTATDKQLANSSPEDNDPEAERALLREKFSEMSEMRKRVKNVQA